MSPFRRPDVLEAFVRNMVAFGRKILRKEWVVEAAVDENSRVYFEGSLDDAIMHFFGRIRSSRIEAIRIDATTYLLESFFKTLAEVGPSLWPHILAINADLRKFSARDIENAITSLPAVGCIVFGGSLMTHSQVTDNFLRECVKKGVYELYLPKMAFHISEDAIIAFCCSTSPIAEAESSETERYIRVVKELVSRRLVTHLLEVSTPRMTSD